MKNLRIPVIIPSAIVLITPGMWAADWLTVSGNPQRTAWQKPEAPAAAAPGDDDDDDKSAIGIPLNKETVRRMQLLWKLKLENQPRGMNSIFATLIVQQIVTDRGFKELAVVAGSSGKIFAIDADLGKLFWQRDLPDAAGAASGSNCPGGVTAVPVIQTIAGVPGRSFPRYIVHMLAGDGTLRALNLANGVDQSPPLRFLPPQANAHALNRWDSRLYTATSGQCGSAPDGVWAIDVGASERAVAHYASPGADASVAIGENGTVYAMTASRIVALSPENLNVRGAADLGGRGPEIPGMTPAVFDWKGRELVAAADGSGRLVLFDGAGMKELTSSPVAGIHGGLATWEDDKGSRWIYAPRRSSPDGSIAAFRVDDSDGRLRLSPVWQSRNLASPEPPVISDGIVFALSSGRTPILYALDAATGQELYASGTSIASFAHSAGLTVANNRVYVSTFDGTLYCFGFPLER